MKILVIDTLYDDFLKTVPLGTDSYDVELGKVMARCFGTFDAYSRNLRALGWDAIDVIANHDTLQRKWITDYWTKQKDTSTSSDWRLASILEAQIAWYRPDVVFCQDLSLDLPWGMLPLLAGQSSCRFADERKMRRYDVLFSSFPGYPAKFSAIGVRGVYNPLAFDPIVLDRFFNQYLDGYITSPELLPLDLPPKRNIDVSFVGGVGNPSYWRQGLNTLETVARETPTFKAFGYGYDKLEKSSPLLKCFHGEAFGLDMYRIFLQSKIVINRHPEIAEGFANNMRCYESTGCGAMLLTDGDTDLFAADEIVRYSSPEDAVEKIRYYLAPAHEDERAAIAARGQKRTLRDHGYLGRMKTISETLQEMLCAA